MTDHLDLAYFREQYAADDDPWDFDTSWYERRKYDLTLAALPRERYRRGVEPGCANGALTEGLAARCDELVAFDPIESVVANARRRLAKHPNVEVRQAMLPDFWPEGAGDLVVWSEMAYYLTSDGAARAVEGLDRWLEPEGHVVSVHYTGETDYPRRGDEIRPWLDAVPWLNRLAHLVDQRFELAVWERT